LPPEVAAELELRGVDGVRIFLAGQGSYGGVGTERDMLFKFGNVEVRRGDVEDWLRWKDAVKALWVKVAAIAAVISAVAAIVAAAK
jgi:hypothetical protein